MLVGAISYSTGRTVNTAVSQASVSRSIKEVTDAMNRPDVFRNFVNFPNTKEELRKIQMGFFNSYGFPGVIGAIVCTHVAIIAPKSEDPLYPEAIYVDRKGYHSINVHLICNSDLKILNVCAQYPGSTNDAFIWNNCEVNNLLQNLHRNGHRSLVLLGDSGYPLRPWLLTPLNEIPEPNSPEERYNNCHMSARSTIERCNGLLKSRFRCLLKHRVLHYHPERASKIINTCVMLHNFCLENNLPPPDNEDQDIPNWDFGLLQPLPNEENIIQNRANPELIAG